MMQLAAESTKVYLCREAVDLRKSINGLSVLVESVLELNPFSAHGFVFCNRRRDKVKILDWERNGFCVWYKRLEQQRFRWPEHLEGETITLTGQELRWLLEGYDLRYLRPHEALSYKSVL